MVYYIYSEIKRTIKEKNFLYYLIGIVAVSVLANLSMIAFRDMIYGTNDGTQAYNLVMFAGGFFWLPYYTMIFIADMVFGKTYPDPYLRNRANIGLKRSQQYIGKLISEYIMLLFFVIFAFIVFIGVSFLFQISAGPIEGAVVADFAKDLLYSMPLFAAGLTVANMFLFMFRSKKKAFVVFFALVIGLERLIMLLGAQPFSIPFCKWLKDTVLITPQFTTLQFYATRNVPQIIISSVIYIAIAAVVGCWCFLKKDTETRRRKDR